jgi:hypothetical protein
MASKAKKQRPISLKGLYPVIGEFVIQYAIVQGTIRTVFLRLLDVTGDAGAILVYGMSDAVIVRKLKLALQRHGDDFPKFEPALKRLHDITLFRDKLIHWMPFTDSKRTTLEGIVDILRDFRSVNQPALNFAPKQMRRMTAWLRAFELDLLTLLLAIDHNEALKESDYQTLDDGIFPDIPQAGYGVVMMKNKEKSQSERFKEAARELGCDENEEAVDELMKRVAKKAPPRKDDGATQPKEPKR